MSTIKLVNGNGEQLNGKNLPWQRLRDEAVLIARKAHVRPKTKGQEKYLYAIHDKSQIICTGPAGTGKTYLACGVAMEMLLDEKIKRIIVTRPAVTCGQGLGYLPGDINEKTGPFVAPMIDAFTDFIDIQQVETFRQSGQIKILPLDFMRGLSLRDTFLICDEAQNAEWKQLKMLLTRYERNAKVVVVGDASQSDIPSLKDGVNPLMAVIRRCEHKTRPDIGIARMTEKDIVRNDMVKWMVERLSDDYTPPPYDSEWEWLSTTCPSCRTVSWWEGSEKDVNDEQLCVICRRCKSFVYADGVIATTEPPEEHTVVETTYAEPQG